VLPILLFFITFVFWPMVYTFYVSFFEWNGFGPVTNYVGLGNYRRFLRDHQAINTLTHTVYFTVGALIGQLGLGFFLALIIDRVKHAVGITRLVYFMPNILPAVAVSLLWARLLYAPTFGPFNAVLEALGLINVAPGILWPGWILENSSAMNSIVLMSIWQYAGYYMVIYLAGLKAIPEEYQEAATVDGANGWQVFRHITLPLLRPTITFTVVINVIGSMQVFTPVVIMTEGGPARATEVTVLHIFRSTFSYFEYSYGATLAVMLFLIIMMLSIIQLRLLRSRASL
jgi:multiple sugar transport system permease protein